VAAVCAKDAEFGGPAWLFGSRSYALLPDGRLLVTYSDPSEASERLAVLDPADSSLTNVGTSYYQLGYLSVQQV
jgi:hypothetical protein